MALVAFWGVKILLLSLGRHLNLVKFSNIFYKSIACSLVGKLDFFQVFYPHLTHSKFFPSRQDKIASLIIVSTMLYTKFPPMWLPFNSWRKFTPKHFPVFFFMKEVMSPGQLPRRPARLLQSRHLQRRRGNPARRLQGKGLRRDRLHRQDGKVKKQNKTGNQKHA